MRRTKLNALDIKAVKLLSNLTKAQLKDILDNADLWEIFYKAWGDKNGNAK